MHLDNEIFVENKKIFGKSNQEKVKGCNDITMYFSNDITMETITMWSEQHKAWAARCRFGVDWFLIKGLFALLKRG